MTLALAQLEIDSGDVAGNRARAVDAVEAAANRGADLVALPEIFTVGYFAFDSYAEHAEPLDGKTVKKLQAVAAKHDIGVLAGSIVEDLEASSNAGFETPAESGYANASVFIDTDGTSQGVYRKHHLFGYDSAEQDLLTSGESLATVAFGNFTVGMTTCYDLRFPELYRRLVDKGVSLILVPSAWPYPRVEHWKLLPRARAVENLCYVATINGSGTFDDATLVGRSTVYDPWGTAVARLDEEPGIVTTQIEHTEVQQRRTEFPALEDRRY
ncbi:nitrilase-related carbon-nitrogen hydrolase [Halovenus rubra]|uniref:Nitrilase-related carbon-nitrogen hydrolase n=2 Tax=Halovenus rubra TaxID=869890 RepID=A0ACC7DZ26_9EURY|nr:nitrilase-related carbon-nitrogen hydrolase [Halovenus rubra]